MLTRLIHSFIMILSPPLLITTKRCAPYASTPYDVYSYEAIGER